MAHSSFQRQRCTVTTLSCHRWIVLRTLVEFGETVLAHLPAVGKGSGNPTPKLADRWKCAVWLGKSDLTDEHLVRKDDGVVYARSLRRLAEHSWSEEHLRSVVETRQKSRSTATDDASDLRVVPEVHEHDNEKEEKNEDGNENEQHLDKPEDDDHDMQGEMIPEPDTTTTNPRTTSLGRGEKRSETPENVFTKKRLMMKSPKRPVTPVPLPENPMKRRLMKKTDLRNDDSVMKVDADQLNMVNTLTSDETVPETNFGEDSELPRMLTILDDPKEVIKGRQKELNSLKGMGVMTAVKRTTAAGKRVIHTRWVDRAKDGCVQSRLVLKDINHSHGRMQTEMCAPTPSTLSLKTMLATSSHDRNNHSEDDYVAIAIDVHTAFLRADFDQDLYAEQPEESELNEDEVWKLHKVRIQESTKNVASTCGDDFGKSEFPFTIGRFVLLQYINIFIHVDDELLFGPSSELQRLIEHLSSHVMMRIVGRLVQQDDQVFILGRVIKSTVYGYSVEANPKYVRDVITVLGLEDGKPVATPSVKRTPTTESLVELENERRAVDRTAMGKRLYMCQERADIMYSVKERQHEKSFVRPIMMR